MANEHVDMYYMDDPADICRVYRFEVRVSKKRLLNKYFAVWFIVKSLWKVVRHGKKKAAD